MFWKNLETDIYENSNKKTENATNPFSVNINCNFQAIWDKITLKTQELNRKCYPNTYVWIEKFKEDNYLE